MSTAPVVSKKITATATALAHPTRVRAMWLTWNVTGGAGIVLRDGGATGQIRIDLDTPAAIGAGWARIPDEGVKFETDVHATLTNVISATIFYG